jgi:predicted phage terminase large subunit-like protein
MPWHPFKRVRSYDFASSEADGACATAGVKMTRWRDDNGNDRFTIDHAVRGKWSPAKRKNIVKKVAEADGPLCQVVIEMEPGSASADLIAEYARWLVGYSVRGWRPRGSKQERADVLAGAFENGLVSFVKFELAGMMQEEMKSFPLGDYCDLVDAASQAYLWLTHGVPLGEVQGGLMCSGLEDLTDDSDEPTEFDRIEKAELEAFSPGLRKILDGFVDDDDQYGDLFGRE